MKSIKSDPLNYMMMVISMVLISVSCIQVDPNTNKNGVDVMQPYLQYTDHSIQTFEDTVYVPVYSDIYSETRQRSTLMTATLSIRSTSLRDTTYINDILYYNTQGDIVRSYIEKTLILSPMQSIDYVIDRDDVSGGSGANFLVTWGARKDTRPIFQAVMIGTSGQHGLSFVTDGVSITR